MRIIAFISLVLFLSSCSPQAKLRRADRLIKEAIASGASWKSDTVYVEKTVLVPEVKIDTVFTSLVGDTVTITKEKLRIKYVKLPGDSVYIEGKVIQDTLIIEVPVSVDNEIKAPPSKYRLIHIIGGSILALILGLILGFVFGKFT